MNGSLSSLGTASNVEISFVWGATSGEPYANETAPKIMNAPGAFSFHLTGLTPSTKYYFKEKAVDDSTAYGTERNFATDERIVQEPGAPVLIEDTLEIGGWIDTKAVYIRSDESNLHITVENVWSLFKRSVIGSYHKLSAKHLDAYLDELEWRFNNRDNPYLFRDTLLKLINSDNLTYQELCKEN